MISDSSFSCKDLENLISNELKAKFNVQPVQNLNTLKEDLQKKETISPYLAFKIIKLLCSKKIPVIDRSIQKEFFKSLSQKLKIKEQSDGLFQSVLRMIPLPTYKDKFVDMSHNDILVHLCHKLIKSNVKPDLAAEMAHLISASDPISEEYNHQNLALVALEKRKQFGPFVKALIPRLPPESLPSYLNKRNDNGENLLLLACKYGLQDLVNLLINYGADTCVEDNQKNTPLYLAIESEMSNLEGLILQMNDFRFRDKDQNNYPLLALMKGQAPYISLLIRTPDDILHRNKDGISALSLACEKGYKEIFSKMLDLELLDFKKTDEHIVSCFINILKKGYPQSAHKFFVRGFNPSPEDTLKILPIISEKGYKQIENDLKIVLNNFTPKQRFDCLLHGLKARDLFVSSIFLESITLNPDNNLRELKEYLKENPTILLWFFNNFLADSSWKEKINWDLELIVKHLIQSVSSGKLEHDINAVKQLLKFETIKSILIQETTRLLKSKSFEYLINLLCFVGNEKVHAYLDVELINQIKTYILKLSKERKINLRQARLIEEVFPQEFIRKLSDNRHNKIYVNTLILDAVGINLGTNKLQTLFYFRKIYDYLSQNILDFADLDEERLATLKYGFGFFKIPLPFDLLGKKYDSQNEEMREFLKNPYYCFNQKELTIQQFHPDLAPYLNYHPDIEKITIDVDSLKGISSDDWESILKKLAKLKEVYLNFNSDSKDSINFLNLFFNSEARRDLIRGFTFSKQIPTVIFSLEALKNLSSLKLSNVSIDGNQFLKLVKSCPQLKELHLEDCEWLTGEVLHSIPPICSQLSSIHLEEKLAISLIGELTTFIQRYPQIKSIYFSSISDENLTALRKALKDLPIYVEGKKVLPYREYFELNNGRLSVFPSDSEIFDDVAKEVTSRKVLMPASTTWFRTLPAALNSNDRQSLIDCGAKIYIANEDYYLTKVQTFCLFNFIIEHIKINDFDLDPEIFNKNIMIKFLDSIKKKGYEGEHPLVSDIKKIEHNLQAVNYCLCIVRELNSHTLDEYIPKEQLDQIYVRIKNLALAGNLQLDQARILSKHFPQRVKISVKGSQVSWEFHPLPLLSASRKLREIYQERNEFKIFTLNEFLLKYLHSYLEENCVNLESIDIEGLYELCQGMKKCGIDLDKFFTSVKDQKIKIKIKTSYISNNRIKYLMDYLWKQQSLLPLIRGIIFIGKIDSMLSEFINRIRKENVNVDVEVKISQEADDKLQAENK